jgi:hypothetical protein
MVPDGTHVNPRTVRRWCMGDAPVPFWVEALLRAERERRAAAFTVGEQARSRHSLAQTSTETGYGS